MVFRNRVQARLEAQNLVRRVFARVAELAGRDLHVPFIVEGAPHVSASETGDERT